MQISTQIMYISYLNHSLTRVNSELRLIIKTVNEAGINSQYELKLTASDNLKENYTVVVIHVKDVNDNPPVFERPTYRTQITEEDDRNLPKRVLQVSYWIRD